jgi:uncharacterized surface protein with fasciclin (FAS1) repeats
MTSCYGSDPDLDFTFLYDNIKDEKEKILKNSLLYIIENEERLTMFRYMVKLSNLDWYFNDIQTCATVFIPTDEYISRKYPGMVENLDVNTAYKIVTYSIVPKKVSKKGLLYSGMFYLDTKCKTTRLMIDSTNGEHNIIINKNKIGQVNILQTDIQAINGIIHIIDSLLIPETLF